MEAESGEREAGGQAQNEALASRANIYLILARCFRPPETGLEEDLDLLEQMLRRLYAPCLTQAEALRKTYQTTDREALRVSHAKLFVGPYDLLAPPYGSVYLDSERRVMGDSTMEAATIYERAGLSLDPTNHEPPDHFATELEFMYYLGFQQATGRGDGLEELERRFLLNHLGRWMEPFTDRILASGLGGFYATLAELTAKFIALEMDRLSPSSPLVEGGAGQTGN
jgi:TorA maturation chaperone TorD